MNATTQQQAITISPASPEVHAASRFAITVNVAEFNMAVGRPRHVYRASGEVVAAGIEYTHAFSLSPTAAKQLSMILSVALKDYEEKYGAIPDDPNLAKHMTEVSSDQGVIRRPTPARKSAKRTK